MKNRFYLVSDPTKDSRIIDCISVVTLQDLYFICRGTEWEQFKTENQELHIDFNKAIDDIRGRFLKIGKEYSFDEIGIAVIKYAQEQGDTT